jgi:hypothetical protein
MFTAPTFLGSSDWAVALATFGAALGSICGAFLLDKRQQDSRRREHHTQRCKESLQHFYDPLHLLLRMNRTMLASFGPATNRDTEDDHAADFWQHVVMTFILPNNAIILDLLKSKSSYIAPWDSHDKYIALAQHIISYARFREAPVGAGGRVRFPADIVQQVEVAASRLRRERDTGEEEQHGRDLAKE